MFNKIQNPDTGKWVNINGTVGRKVLNNYVRQAGGAAAAKDDSRSAKRDLSGRAGSPVRKQRSAARPPRAGADAAKAAAALDRVLPSPEEKAYSDNPSNDTLKALLGTFRGLGERAAWRDECLVAFKNGPSAVPGEFYGWGCSSSDDEGGGAGASMHDPREEWARRSRAQRKTRATRRAEGEALAAGPHRGGRGHAVLLGRWHQ